MILVAGDSFVYGSELPNEYDDTFASKLGITNCIAWPGLGNDAIARITIDACENYAGGVEGVLVSWTFPSRYEFKFTYNTYQIRSPWHTINSWTIEDDTKYLTEMFLTQNDTILNHHVENHKRAKETGVHEFAKAFYKHVASSEYWEVYSTLKEIVYLQNYLKVKNIPYMFTCADTCILYNWTCDNAVMDSTIRSLYNQVFDNLDKWFLFPAGTAHGETQHPRGFYQWAVENKYPVGTTHPLEEAHTDAAELMREKFNELVKKFVQ